MDGQAPEEAEIVVICRHVVAVFLQPDDGFVTFDIIRQDDVDATDGMLQDAIYKVCHIRYKFDHPLRVGSLTQCPLKDIRFLYSFQEVLESVGIRDQTRFVEVSTAAVTRAMIISVSIRCSISKNKT